jgi:peptidylprolyl isomerase
MKFLMLFSIGVVSLALVACGQSDSTGPGPSKTAQTGAATSPADRSSQRRGRMAMTKAEIAKLPQYTIGPPHGPPARRLVIHDLRKGFGAKMKAGDSILVGFAGAEYGYTVHTTDATRNAPEKFTFKEIVKGWQKGLPGMRVGGRRELIVPKALGTAGSSATYVVDLLAIYPQPAG